MCLAPCIVVGASLCVCARPHHLTLHCPAVRTTAVESMLLRKLLSPRLPVVLLKQCNTLACACNLTGMWFQVLIPFRLQAGNACFFGIYVKITK